MSNLYELVILDVSGIQNYVFRTNNLQHHLGASELVRCVTSTWVCECLPMPNNMPDDTSLRDEQQIERGDIQAEVIYRGGGNAVILFADAVKADRFVQCLSRKTLIEAPGLSLTIVRQRFEWTENGKDLGAIIKHMFNKNLRLKKAQACISADMLGLSVTADCEFTGGPAVTRDTRDNQRISAEIAAKLHVVPQANTYLSREIGDYKCVYDFEEFGTKGESSYIAVIHADGNRMGKRFEQLANANLSNRKYIRAVRALSQSVSTAAQTALKQTVTAISTMQRVNGTFGGVVPQYNGRLPFRPIIFGGDDATFVCDGRMGLTIAATYLKAFANQHLVELDNKTSPSARAGIAIVKTHFPFGRAYALAEELANSARAMTDSGTHSALDWHFGINGVVMSIANIRNRDYVATDSQHSTLLTRPLRLEESLTEWRTWPVFTQLVKTLQNTDSFPRNKIKAFREALRNGPDTAKRYIAAHFTREQRTLLRIPNASFDNGWYGTYCAYFDAIEAMEFFVPLEEQHGHE